MQGGNFLPTASLRIPSFGSSWESDMGNDAFSQSSWDVVQAWTHDSTNEDDAHGAEISDAESLDMMLKEIVTHVAAAIAQVLSANIWAQRPQQTI
jgi:hypothetical protein